MEGAEDTPQLNPQAGKTDHLGMLSSFHGFEEEKGGKSLSDGYLRLWCDVQQLFYSVNGWKMDGVVCLRLREVVRGGYLFIRFVYQGT